MKKIEQIKQTVTKTRTEKETRTLFSELSKNFQIPVFNRVFPEQDNFKFVRGILHDDFVIFFTAELSMSKINAIMEDGVSYEELKNTPDLEEYGIVWFTKDQIIRRLLSLENKSHCTKQWIDGEFYYIYCQTGSNYSYERFAI